VVRCVGKCLRFGLEAALGELPRSGQPRRVSEEALVWVRDLACQKPQGLGYAQALWTYRLLGEHIRRHGTAAGHKELARLSRSKLHRILTQGELQPHQVRYYVERRDPEFEPKMTSAPTSKQTQRYLAEKPQRFQFVFVPKHGSWLNLVENRFSKMARSMLREIRVATKQELIDRIHLYCQEVNAAPVVFRWKYKMDEIVIA
jgi:hypothetical protein